MRSMHLVLWLKKIGIAFLVLALVVFGLTTLLAGRTLLTNLSQKSDSGINSTAPSVGVVDEVIDPSTAVSKAIIDDSGSIAKDIKDRKIVKTGSLELIVDKVDRTIGLIRELVQKQGGIVAEAQVREVTDDVQTATIAIRIPANQYDETVTELKSLAVRVINEQESTQDVTGKFVDLDARIKNFKAQEKQFLTLLEKSTKVDDTLQIIQHLNSVRTQIDFLEGERKVLNEQVDLSTITLSLEEEADITVFGVHWRPLVEIKKAGRFLVEGLVDFVNIIFKLVFAIPLVVLWGGLIWAIIFYGWKFIRWLIRRL